MVDKLARQAEVLALRRRVSSIATVAEATSADMLARRLQIGTGAAPLIVLGATANVDIVWPVPFLTPVYQVAVSGLAGILGRATLERVGQTETAVTVKITADLAVTAGSLFVAVAMC